MAGGVPPAATRNSWFYPEGMLDNSPPFQRWVEVFAAISPEGTTEFGQPAHQGRHAIGHNSAVPKRLGCTSICHPTLTRWAITSCPFGTENRSVPRLQVSVALGQTHAFERGILHGGVKLEHSPLRDHLRLTKLGLFDPRGETPCSTSGERPDATVGAGQRRLTL